MSLRNKKLIYGIYGDDHDLLEAVKHANSKELDIHDVYSPFPVHGLDPLLKLKESRLHIGGFIFGMMGTLTALGFMSWVHAVDWPNVFGGKPYWPLPSFIPITFEVTVLFASIGMVVTYYIINGQGPGVVNPVLDDRLTDDKFAIVFDTTDMPDSELGHLQDFFSQSGAEEVHTKSF